jgi:hypothetical protein
VQVLVDNVLDCWCEADPARIGTKPTLHVLTCLVENLRRFGPAILYSTEIFECWNAIFRFCSILSNHQSPSHDIATSLGDMERFKHQVSGGFWKDLASGAWIQAGVKIRAFMADKPQLQRRLGWVEKPLLPAGQRQKDIHVECELILCRYIQNALKKEDYLFSVGADHVWLRYCASTTIHSCGMRRDRLEVMQICCDAQPGSLSCRLMDFLWSCFTWRGAYKSAELCLIQHDYKLCNLRSVERARSGLQQASHKLSLSWKDSKSLTGDTVASTCHVCDDMAQQRNRRLL